MIKKTIGFILIAVTLTACETPAVTAEENIITPYIEAIKSQFSPDKRVALFDVNATEANGQNVVKGMTNLPEALAVFKAKLAANNIAFVDSIEILPTTELKKTTHAVINISVANLRSNPKHSAELSTQAILGTTVNVYKKVDNWYLIQTPDQYLAWVDSGGLTLLDQTAFDTWNAAPKLIYLDVSGFSYEQPNANSQVVSDVVAGNIVENLGQNGAFYKIQYPDKRIAYLPKEKVMNYATWLATLTPTENALVNTGKKLMGTPYLWGGTSSKGVDCSGFTKTIFFLNGMVIPRDASQQIHTGELVDETKSFDQLHPGDLLFFGKPATETSKERVVHVGMWIGNNEFIHSAGKVHISSIDPKSTRYDAYNLGRYLRSKRLLNKPDKAIINLTQQVELKN